jgi:hypothetical protein
MVHTRSSAKKRKHDITKVVYKIAQDCNGVDKCIIALGLTPDSVCVQNSSTGKCRTSRAVTLAIRKLHYFDSDGTKKCPGIWIKNKNALKTARSAYYDKGTYIYKVGDLQIPKEEFDTRLGTCSSGIHYFTNAYNALEYAVVRSRKTFSYKPKFVITIRCRWSVEEFVDNVKV